MCIYLTSTLLLNLSRLELVFLWPEVIILRNDLIALNDSFTILRLCLNSGIQLAWFAADISPY